MVALSGSGSSSGSITWTISGLENPARDYTRFGLGTSDGLHPNWSDNSFSHSTSITTFGHALGTSVNGSATATYKGVVYAAGSTNVLMPQPGPPPVSPPFNFFVSVNQRDISLSWTKGSNATTTEFQRPWQSSAYDFSTGSTSWSFTVPSFNTSYTVYARSVSSDGRRSGDSSVSFTSGSPPPATPPTGSPSMTSLTANFGHTLTANWNSGSVSGTFNGYNVYANGFQKNLSGAVFPPYSFGIDYEYSTYSVYVRAVGPGGESSSSGSLVVRSKDETGPTVSIVGSSKTDTTITLTVSGNDPPRGSGDGASGVLGYRPYLNNAAQTLVTSGNTVTFTGLTFNTTYTVGVEALDNDLNSGPRVSQTITTNPRPSAVFVISSVTKTNGIWVVDQLENPFNQTFYREIVVATNTVAYGSPSRPTGVLGAATAPATGTDHGVAGNMPGLTPGTTYTAYAYAQSNDNNYYPAGGSQTFTTDAALHPPTSVTATVAGKNVTLNWTKATDTDAYWTAIDADGNGTEDYKTTGTTQTITMPNYSTTYTVYLRTDDINNTVFSAWTSITFTTDATDPVPTRPNNFTWTTAKIKGQPVAVTAVEWNALTTRINDFQTYKGVPTTIIGLVIADSTIRALYFNSAVNAINTCTPPITCPTVSVGNDLSAFLLNRMVDSLNSIA